MSAGEGGGEGGGADSRKADDRKADDRKADDRKAHDRKAKADAYWAQLFGGNTDRMVAGFDDLAPDFGLMLRDFAFGEVLSRPGLKPRERQIATLAALTALGTARPQLELHIKGALNLGLTREEILEVIIQMAVYGGFPAAINGMQAARAAFAAVDEKAKAKG